jgi:hypothetical protein
MPKTPADTEIVKALQPFQPPKDDADPQPLVEAIVKALLNDNATVKLENLPGLEDEDGTARARQTYVLSYLRILDFLRRASDTFSERKAQAILSLSFIRHAESHSLDILQLGRQTGDDKLLAKVTQLQQALESQAQYAIEQDRRNRELHERPDPQVTVEGQGEGGATESGTSAEARVKDPYVN